jgi:HD-like signal output (HDOD) protein
VWAAESIDMFARVWSWFRRARPASTPVVDRPESSLSAIPPAALTVMDILRDQVERHGGPACTVLPDGVGALAAVVMERACEIPAPPSFPAVATRVLAISRDPDHDLNQLVGAVQRDAAIASALLRYANSAMFATAEPVTTLRAAVQKLGMQQVVEVVMGQIGRGYYQLATPEELALFPELWKQLADDGMANGFAAGRLAMDVAGARSERALLGGLLAEIGRPVALRVICRLIAEGAPAPDDARLQATLDEVAPAVGALTISRMQLPADVIAACAHEGELDIDARIAQLVAGIGAVQRRGPRVWSHASAVRTHVEALVMRPLAVRALFAQRLTYVEHASKMFA